MKKSLPLIAALLLSANVLAGQAESSDAEHYKEYCPSVYKNDFGARACRAVSKLNLDEGEQFWLLMAKEKNVALARILARRGFTREQIDTSINIFATCDMYKWCMSYEQRK